MRTVVQSVIGTFINICNTIYIIDTLEYVYEFYRQLILLFIGFALSYLLRHCSPTRLVLSQKKVSTIPGGRPRVELHCNKLSSVPSHDRLLKNMGASVSPGNTLRSSNTETTIRSCIHISTIITIIGRIIVTNEIVQ